MIAHPKANVHPVAERQQHVSRVISGRLNFLHQQITAGYHHTMEDIVKNSDGLTAQEVIDGLNKVPGEAAETLRIVGALRELLNTIHPGVIADEFPPKVKL